MEQNHPNVLWICTDQQRFDTLGCYGNPYIDTPNLDLLAKSGIKFENAYCQSPVCTPSRASFLTGRYPRTTNCYQNGQMIPQNERLISKMLSDHGYYCGLSGKLHLSPCAPKSCKISEQRIDDGFHEFHWSHHPAGIGIEGVPESGGCNWPGNEYSRWLHHEGVKFFRKDYDPQGYVQIGMDEAHHQTTWCMQQAIDWIDYAAAMSEKQPWFYLVNIFDPHHVFDPPEELLSKYAERADHLPLPVYKAGELGNKSVFQQMDHNGAYNAADHYTYDKMSKEEHRLVKAAYYAMVELVDRAVGNAMACLTRNNLLDDTLIIFSSDHGEMLGDHGIYLKGPYFYEGLTHVPLIMSWKNHIPADKKSNALVELTDIVPTISELCIGSIEDGVQGKSLVPILTGSEQDDQHRSSVYCEYYDAMPWHQTPSAQATMVFDGQYKLCRYHSTDEGELYDLTKDPFEHENLWADQSYSEVKNKLLLEMIDRMAGTVDPANKRIDKW